MNRRHWMVVLAGCIVVAVLALALWSSPQWLSSPPDTSIDDVSRRAKALLGQDEAAVKREFGPPDFISGEASIWSHVTRDLNYLALHYRRDSISKYPIPIVQSIYLFDQCNTCFLSVEPDIKGVQQSVPPDLMSLIGTTRLHVHARLGTPEAYPIERGDELWFLPDGKALILRVRYSQDLSKPNDLMVVNSVDAYTHGASITLYHVGGRIIWRHSTEPFQAP